MNSLRISEQITGRNTCVESLERVVFALCMLVACLVCSNAANAQTSKTPIAVAQVNDWNFGIIYASTTAGTVSLGTNGARSATGGITPVNTIAVTPQAASFKVTGASSSTYSIVFPSSISLTRTGGSQTLTIDGFKSSGSGVLTNGTETISVGATLHVGALQTNGAYTGTNYLTVAYN